MFILGLCVLGLIYLLFIVMMLVLFIIPLRIDEVESKMFKLEWQKPTLIELDKRSGEDVEKQKRNHV
jgi:hypothetical protein